MGLVAVVVKVLSSSLVRKLETLRVCALFVSSCLSQSSRIWQLKRVSGFGFRVCCLSQKSGFAVRGYIGHTHTCTASE